MLPQSARLKSKRDFQAVFSKGRSFGTDLIVIHVLGGTGGEPRFGFSVSAKLGKATVRNRVKRMLREAVRTRLAGIRNSNDVVIVARVKCKDADFTRISESVGRLLRKARLLEGDAESLDG